ncbi:MULTISPECIES: sugar ABC transporter permease [unclassified Clostridium]|uniref:carbohydrate ABC transporter permease n=1 Tax=unclassified Clostridium TaxID=2614128 RepID=UPI0002983630|nr:MULTISPECIES: sugar ABC transporter permease [unclassified Clostridium]EKQ56614.1 MAG: permease component of ABC-type sugar transporter [Clostridium sp. Maddingley MBC34-26]
MDSMRSSSDITLKQQFDFVKWVKSGKVQKRLVICSFSFFPLLLLFIFTYLPFYKMIEFSFYNMKYIGPQKWVGLQNYVDVFQRDDCFTALTLSFYYMAASFVQLGIALLFASILSFKTKGGAFIKGAMFFPYLISGIAVGFIFKFFYARGFVLDSLLQAIGFNLDQLPYWIKDTRINNASLAATSVWRYMGQNMVLFIGAIMSVDRTLYEAADIDGANKFQRFLYIMLPGIKNIVILNMILSITGSLSAFEPPYIITNGNMGTGTYFVIMNRIAYENQKVGLASAMAVVLLIIIILCTVAQKVLFSYLFIDADERAELKVKKKKKLKAKVENIQGGQVSNGH